MIHGEKQVEGHKVYQFWDKKGSIFSNSRGHLTKPLTTTDSTMNKYTLHGRFYKKQAESKGVPTSRGWGNWERQTHEGKCEYKLNTTLAGFDLVDLLPSYRLQYI